MEKRKDKTCPKCGSQLLAREGKFIFCLNFSCNWAVQSQRDTDKEIKSVPEIKKEWY